MIGVVAVVSKSSLRPLIYIYIFAPFLLNSFSDVEYNYEVFVD